MNQEIFLKELERLLEDIPEEERIEALEYYRCYFEDAGEENEASVLEELGSPEKVAQTIKADLKGDTAEGGFTEKGYEEFIQKEVPGTKEQLYEQEQSTGSGQRTYEKQNTHEAQKKRSTAHNAVSAPLRILGAVCMVIVAVIVIVVMISVAIALIAAMAGMGVTAVACAGVGIGGFITGAPAVGLGMFCGGAVCLAIFFLLLLAVVTFCRKALPAATRGICSAASKTCRGRRR